MTAQVVRGSVSCTQAIDSMPLVVNLAADPDCGCSVIKEALIRCRPAKRKSARISNARRASLPVGQRENGNKAVSNPSILQSPTRRRRSLQAVLIR